jgi:cell division protease FtsH
VSLRTEQESFLGDELSARREYSELTAQKADQEISQILENAYQRARDILVQHRAALDRVVEALLEKEQLLGPELMALLQVGSEPVRRRPRRSFKHHKPVHKTRSLPSAQRRA